MRPAINDLLITFAVLQELNALVFYPLLDFAANMDGDWKQMYSGEAGNWRWVVLAVHASILLGGYLLSRSAWFNRKLNALTGMPAGVNRGMLGGGIFSAPRQSRPQVAGVRPQPAPAPRRLTLVEERLSEAGKRVASGWNGTVTPQLRSTPSSSELLMIWSDGVTGVIRSAALRALPDGSGELWGVLISSASGQQQLLTRGQVQRWDALPDENTLTFSLRLGMEQIARWPIPPVPSDAPNPKTS